MSIARRYVLGIGICLGTDKAPGRIFQRQFQRHQCGGAGMSYDRDIEAYYANLTWLVTGERYADNYRGDRMVRLRPKNNFAPGKTCCGAWELGLRYSKFDAGDFKSSNPAGTGVIPSGNQRRGCVDAGREMDRQSEYAIFVELHSHRLW